MIGAALMAREAVGARRERAARRLPDADREPRGHHAARAVRAARRRRRRVRGHAPDRRAARALRRPGLARPLPRAQRARADARPGRAHARRRGRRARLAMRACRWSPIPATCSCRAASRRGWRSRCCRGRRRRWRRWSPRRCPPTSGASSGSCRASGRALVEAFAGPETLVAFESPRRVAASLAVLAELDPDAAGRGLPGAHEAARGGRARARPRSWRRATRRRSRAGEVVLVVGGAPPRTGVDEAAVDAVRAAGRVGRPRAGRRRAWCRS